MLEVIIVGGGPCGIACAIELKKRGISHLVIEKGSITESIRKYPLGMTFFSTAENLEIGGLPFAINGAKPTRNEALQYYRKTAAYYDVKLKLFVKVEHIENAKDHFIITTDNNETYDCKNVVMATGYFDFPRKLNIPGENLPHVAHYYDEPFRHAFTEVVIVGGGNSAIEAALDLYRHNVKTTLVLRNEDFKPTAKYWLTPDLKNRIKEGKIHVVFQTEVIEIQRGKILINNLKTEEITELKADFVYLLVGYVPDVQLLRDCGVSIDEQTLQTQFNKDTFETHVAGLYLCGTVLAGIQTESVFIENGREHAAKIARHINRKTPD